MSEALRAEASRPTEPAPRRRSPWWRTAAVLVTLIVLLGGGGYALYRYAEPYLHGSRCEITGSRTAESLQIDQAGNAAVIAGVAYRKRLPERAVVIAYATAIQESRIRNLAGGDRDSVGMFQQRPSQGWGTPTELRDPVTSTSKFFNALVKVTDYLDRDLHDAAQLVQRSADGSAYAPHEDRSKVLAEGFTGRRPAAVHCWFTPAGRTEPRRAAAVTELTRAFGRRFTVTEAGGAHRVTAPHRRGGWSVAAWAVTQARPYGLTEVRYAGQRWSAEDGHDGWQPDRGASADHVEFR